MRRIHRFTISVVRIPICIALLMYAGSVCAQDSLQDQDGYQAVTAGDPSIEAERLRVLLRPLTKDELEVEASQWLDLLREKIKQVGETELEILALSEGETNAELQEQLVAQRTEESDIVAHLGVVLSALKSKGGDVTESETYITAISDLGETTDATSLRAALLARAKAWMASEDGGQLFARRALVAIIILFISWIMSKFAGRVVSRLLSKYPKASNLLEDFARRTTGGVVLILGALMALAVLGVEIGPMMAALGAGGFIVGFALQETLGSFASGLMIMIYRPFDLDDYVSIAGDEGKVKEMSLVSTSLLTLDNKVIVVPNKKAWSDTIINFTCLDVRRVDLVFGISYDDDIGQAISLLTEMASSHPLVIEDPALTVRVDELADSSVNLFCRPWAKTSDYWTVYWDLTHQVKERFDAEGISFPFPQRDVHLDAPVAASNE